MKKLISLMLIAVMMLPALGAADCGCGCGACICEEEARGVLIAKSETTVRANVFTGAAWWALTAGNRVFGKNGPFENVTAIPANPPRAAWIGGCLDNGIVREHNTMTVIGDGYGLTNVEATITLMPDAVELVGSIIRERLGVDEITVNTIIAATMWWEQSTVCHIFFLPEAPKMWVGTITAGKAIIDLYAGDWAGDGTLVLGFMAGGSPATPEPASTPEPVVIRETVYVKETVVREVVKEKTCVKVIQVNNQININSTVTNSQKVILSGTGCGKNYREKCVED